MEKKLVWVFIAALIALVMLMITVNMFVNKVANEQAVVKEVLPAKTEVVQVQNEEEPKQAQRAEPIYESKLPPGEPLLH